MKSNEEIKGIADQCRVEYWSDEIPVDSELIIECAGLEIIPVGGLREQRIDACVSADLTQVYIDTRDFREDSQSNRLRFSIAHELGHFFLHKDVFDEYSANDMRMPLEWATYVRTKVAQSFSLEREANEFAGCLLVPEERLREECDKLLPAAREVFESRNTRLEDLDAEMVRNYLAVQIHRVFMVSEPVIEIRLRRTGIYPNNH